MEVEVWPAQAEVYFRDERYVDPINTQVRFDAAVYNGSTSQVHWDVQSLSGNPGAGSIDPTGLYIAPTKSLFPYSVTDIVIATSVEDPLRKAVAFVTVIGNGPTPAPQPRIEIAPKQVYLYYPQGYDNAYIDPSNTMQLFRAFPLDTVSASVQWLVAGVVQGGAGPDPWFLYQVTGSGSTKMTTITARLLGDVGVQDEARVIHINYSWPGLV
jgi:hypothetical protein